MMSKPMWIAAVALLVVGAGAWAGASARTRTADVSADEMVFRWQQNEFEFTGNCDLTISAGNTATMKAPRMVVKLTPDGRTIKHLKATGPLTTTVVTAPDAQGVKRKIVARCSQYATYTEADQVVEMAGDAVADLVTLPEAPDAARAHFSGDVLRVSLKAGELTARKARLHVEGEFAAPGQGE